LGDVLRPPERGGGLVNFAHLRATGIRLCLLHPSAAYRQELRETRRDQKKAAIVQKPSLLLCPGLFTQLGAGPQALKGSRL